VEEQVEDSLDGVVSKQDLKGLHIHLKDIRVTLWVHRQMLLRDQFLDDANTEINEEVLYGLALDLRVDVQYLGHLSLVGEDALVEVREGLLHVVYTTE
jgi:hypothetical protein